MQRYNMCLSTIPSDGEEGGRWGDCDTHKEDQLLNPRTI